MAQSEDTELRDLVVEALEKNGSLAKIRALLRANIFLVFEDECENIKQNVSLDSILKLPEGIFCLSLIHEFLEYCNLKNTLFVYMSESRQGKEYSYEGTKLLLEKLKLKRNNNKEPVLVTLIKNVFQQQTKTFGHNERHVKRNENTLKDEQNNTYIVHEDSTTSLSNSTSDNSSDEKNKLHLRLQLDNSDTDTSSDSTRGKTSSEYIPRVPCPEEKTDVDTAKHSTQQPDIQTPSKTNLSNYNNNKNETTKSESSGKDLTEYSLDFTSPASVKKESVSNDKSSESIHNQSLDYSPKIQEDFDQKSITTPDSISTSDVADILSDKSNSSHHKNIDKNSTYSNKSKSISNYSKKSFHDSIKLLDDDFGDFSESPIPSLSNLSLDIHSD
ncbi:PREDICTED: protein TONNEAU 1b-like isoform X1 [Papilio xuthus]|uniref:Protein TONNEAU 1b-like isoform X1 n=1 Tax=Papilio xuthus TaxID=66420 RepID=A0AAJ7E7Z9_PAPXU|nr:PREDICTED: protein TONNEAU 1b-like isoform X1 [Papilio xuthus]